MNERIVSGVIYGLHAGDGVIRYIGYTVQHPNTRLSHHKHTARKGSKRYKDTWIRSVGIDTLEMRILEYYTDIPLPDLEHREVLAIAKAKLEGANLTNLTEGGNTGGRVGIKAATPRKDPRKGMKYPEDVKQQLYSNRTGTLNHFYGRSHSEATKSLMSERHTGKVMSEESRKRMSESAKKRKASDETRLKLQAAGHKRWHIDLGRTNPKCPLC